MPNQQNQDEIKLTKEQAEFIKNLRCGLITHSWRSIASKWYVKYKTGLNGNQLFGKELCENAAKLLGEDPSDEPWN